MPKTTQGKAKGKNDPARQKQTGKAAAKQKDDGRARPESVPDSSALIHQIIPVILGLAGLLTGLCMVWKSGFGFFGEFMQWVLFGGFSMGAVLVPFLLLSLAVFWKRSVEERSRLWRICNAFVCLISLSVILYISQRTDEAFAPLTFARMGLEHKGGGLIGGIVGFALSKLFGSVGSIIISVICLLVFGLFAVGLTPYGVYIRVRYYIQQFREELRTERQYRRQLEEEQLERARQQKSVPPPQPAPAPQEQPSGRNREKKQPDGHKKRWNNIMEENAEPVYEESVPEQSDAPEPPVQEEQESVVDSSAYEAAASEPVTPEPPPEPLPDLPAPSDDDAPPFDVDEPSTPAESSAPAPAEPEKPEEGPLSEEMIRRLTETKVLDPIGGADGSLELTQGQLADLPAPTPLAEEKPEYVYPPATLLNQGTLPDNADISEELQSTAKKLVDTLASFKVRTKIVNVSRGPTITRYELAPEEGVRVRQILNLVDDISLNLATSGVRIEAPIPGKQAVGIEVPNRVVATVYLRRLIENPKFAAAPSKITVCLGEDVAGEPVYLDIAKMPHLLVAGATGMGKSVCINSMIVSLLYKATPEEVKLILVDPKKVELNIYNGLPHLLVPVVSDPKKAAGALQWAVNEMERRFTLIEEVGMRDLKGYNQITKDDPEKEFLPHIVIIIDELADLMMVASDDVEESICRLAQKARAAGMHLIIGTQRPSVDVVTGLIKANVPSRIAFTMASQMDSRTIIDIGGAEKLIGRGDMLYAPVGMAKPIRVQGAFVSEKEIDAITGFIKSHYGSVEYDGQVIESINAEAERCGQGKKNGAAAAIAEGDDAEGGDPMLKAAISLAVESGKISTSLIQRRLQLGYGRAAKLIDQMQEMGIVSAPDGQKPRTVLISKEQYMEMAVNHDLD